MINAQQQYITPDGRLTIAGLQLFGDLSRRLILAESGITALQGRVDAVEAKLAAIAVVASPTGGTTEDAEARAAIVSIINAAG